MTDRDDDHAPDDADPPDLPDNPVAETDVASAARSCSVILLVIAGTITIALFALLIALVT